MTKNRTLKIKKQRKNKKSKPTLKKYVNKVRKTIKKTLKNKVISKKKKLKREITASPIPQTRPWACVAPEWAGGRPKGDR